MLSRNMMQFVAMCFCCLNKCAGRCMSQNFARRDFRKSTIKRLSLFSKSGYRSALECTAVCHRDQECISFFYNTQSGQCTGHAVQFYSTEPGSPDEGSVYFTRPIDRQDCAEILDQNPNSPDGVYIINPLDGKGHFRVYCDMTTDGGGWTVFQRRKDGSEDFYRDWSDYKTGFGTFEGEFWLGNDYINRLTMKREMQLRINLGDHKDQSRFARYSTFRVENEDSNYRLTVSGYKGDAGDSLKYHDGMEFSTKDRDNDKNNINCAVASTGAWWYNMCLEVNLNGKYGDKTSSEGINWYKWHGIKYSLKWTEMKLRPTDQQDCAEILEQKPDSKDGVYVVHPQNGKGHFKVYCDMTTNGRGWTVFQRRQDGSEDFFRDWNDYKVGFGNLEGEFWLGNDNINRLTIKRKVQLRINLGDNKGKSSHATYSTFKVENEANNYRLTVSDYSGKAGDSLKYHDGMEFTTKDRDNDKNNINCAVASTGAWWYNMCLEVNLNGKYGDKTSSKGINWYKWHGIKYSLKWTEMKLKPVDIRSKSKPLKNFQKLFSNLFKFKR